MNEDRIEISKSDLRIDPKEELVEEFDLTPEEAETFVQRVKSIAEERKQWSKEMQEEFVKFYVVVQIEAGKKFAEKVQLYQKLQESLKKLVKNPKFKQSYKKATELIRDAFRAERTCEKCGKTYKNYIIPVEWWQKVPEKWDDKYLCFSCYMELVQKGEEK